MCTRWAWSSARCSSATIPLVKVPAIRSWPGKSRPIAAERSKGSPSARKLPARYPLDPREHPPEMPGTRPGPALPESGASGRRPAPLPGRSAPEIRPGAEPPRAGAEVPSPPSPAGIRCSDHRRGHGPGRLPGHDARRRGKTPGDGARPTFPGQPPRRRKQAHDEGTVQALCLINTAIDLADNLSQGIEVCEKTLALYDVPGKPGQDHPDWALLRTGGAASPGRGPARALPPAGGGPRPSIARSTRGRATGARPAGAGGGHRGLAAHTRPLGGPCALPGHAGRTGTVPGGPPPSRTNSRRPPRAIITCWRPPGPGRGLATDLARAVAELDQALELNPRDYWSSVQRGVCELELGNLVAAAGDFGKCIGLWPDFAWGYFNRGCVLDRGGKKAEAIEDYSAALARDPELRASLRQSRPGPPGAETAQPGPGRLRQGRGTGTGRCRLSRQAGGWHWRRWDGSRKPTPRSSLP